MSDASYPLVQMLIGSDWTAGSSGTDHDVLDPATGRVLGAVPLASSDDLDAALAAARSGFDVWRRTPAFERYRVMRQVADILRQRAPEIAVTMTLEQGKPLAEAEAEARLGADIIDWFAEEGRRVSHRVIPGRTAGVSQMVVKEPVGPVAAFTPWNFPINQAVRKIAAALAAGCSIIVKGPEDTPASCMELVRACADAGVPPGVVNLVFGVPAQVSEHLIPHPVIRKVSFTGSTEVGKQLAALAGQHMKRVTMELGGHAPAVVFDDVDVASTVDLLAAHKFRNAGQVCVSPTRFLVQDGVYDEFVERFVAAAERVKVGSGLEAGTQMGPLVSGRRVRAMEALVADAVSHGATVRTGGKARGGDGFFFEPTVLTGLSSQARIMSEEPFGPVVPIVAFSTYAEAVAEANRLPYGLAAYAFTTSEARAAELGADIESGMVAVNSTGGFALPEVPMGGIKDSGYGAEGGIEAIEAYLDSKFVTITSAR